MDENTDPLDVNIEDIDTSYPILPSGLYDLKIGMVKREPTKDNTGERLTVPLTTTTNHNSVKGEMVPAGLKITHYIGLTPREGHDGKRDYTIQDVRKGVASICKAAGVGGTIKTTVDNPSILDGHVVRTKIGIQKETAEYPESNRVMGFLTV